MYTINFWPILVAAIVAMVIGALWYSPMLFGKDWMTLNKMNDADVKAAKAKGVWGLYVIQFVISLISFCVVGFLVSATGLQTASDGAFLGFLVWLGFVMPIGASGLCWEKKPFKLVLITTVASLLTLVIGAAIIGGWR